MPATAPAGSLVTNGCGTTAGQVPSPLTLCQGLCRRGLDETGFWTWVGWPEEGERGPRTDSGRLATARP